MLKLSHLAVKVKIKTRSRFKSLIVLPHKWKLKVAYEKGRLGAKRGAGNHELTDPRLVEAGQILRSHVLEHYKLKYRDYDYRILFQVPTNGVGATWFYDLMQCLDHTGIPSVSIQQRDSDFRRKWERFLPNVFITMDSPEVLKRLDLDYIQSYKKARGCLRLFTPITKYRFPKPGLSAEDRWRLDLACAGRSADAYFSMMVPEFFDMFFPEWVRAGFVYLSLPNGCNPFRHYPVSSEKKFDYFMVTSYGPERLAVTNRYMKRIFRLYSGLWAGPGWGFGGGPVQPEKLRTYYAQARIAPNPLMSYLIRYPAETTERSFTAAACGAFQITNWTPVTERFFARDELVCISDESEFLDAFAYYVNRPNERNEITLKTLNRVFTSSTYFHRIDILVDFLRKCGDLF